TAGGEDGAPLGMILEVSPAATRPSYAGGQNRGDARDTWDTRYGSPRGGENTTHHDSLSWGTTRSNVMRRSRFPPCFRWKVICTPAFDRLGSKRRRSLARVCPERGHSCRDSPSRYGCKNARRCVAGPSQKRRRSSIRNETGR